MLCYVHFLKCAHKWMPLYLTWEKSTLLGVFNWMHLALVWFWSCMTNSNYKRSVVNLSFIYVILFHCCIVCSMQYYDMSQSNKVRVDSVTVTPNYEWLCHSHTQLWMTVSQLHLIISVGLPHQNDVYLVKDFSAMWSIHWLLNSMFVEWYSITIYNDYMERSLSLCNVWQLSDTIYNNYMELSLFLCNVWQISSLPRCILFMPVCMWTIGYADEHTG